MLEKLQIAETMVGSIRDGANMMDMIKSFLPAIGTSTIIIGALLFMIITQKIKKAVGVVLLSAAVVGTLMFIGII